MRRRSSRSVTRDPRSVRMQPWCASPSETEPMSKSLILCTALLLGSPPAFALDTNRKDVATFIDAMSEKHNFRKSDLKSLLRNAESKRAIIETMQRPPEQVFPWFEYRERLLTERRIGKGLAFVKQQSEALQRAEQATGVSA